MKTSILCIASLLLPTSLLAQSNPKLDSLMALLTEDPVSLRKLDAKNGFRDLKFGTAITAIKSLTAVSQARGGTRFYRRVSDSKAAGRYTLSDILYTSYQGKLSGVILKTKGLNNSHGVLTTFESLYGLGTQDDKQLEEYRWSGSKVFMSYEQDATTNDATIYIWSVPLMTAKKADKEKADMKADEKAESNL